MDDYARFASLYDYLVGPFLRPIYRSMISALISHRCRKIIDVCCGTGMMAGMAMRAGMTPVGVDLSPSMLKVARANYPQATFIDCDAANLFFPDNEFDAAAISFALHEKPHSLAFAIMAEAVRVVRPGGLVLVADYRLPVPPQSRWAGVGISVVERMAGREHYAHFRRFMAQGGIESFLNNAGLLGLPTMTFMHGWSGLFINMKE